MADTNTRTEAKPKKLRNGDWGCVVDGAVSEGEIVTIRTSGGKSWPVVIDKVIWSNGGTSICATRERDETDKAREEREGPVPANAAPAAARPTSSNTAASSSPADDEAYGVPAAPPTPPADDPAFDALADAEASAQAQRADEDDDVTAMAHSFSQDF